ncbi:integral membrane protein [Fusarium heterosporum]|uniref:Integral membrane protein n=1 Tax=Fusarium heterosporum TaxID=42747 RepID=A0A8H5WXL8_FUSHE|nr:integral membrane protein [Fusarium heterosporum]
MYLRRNPELVLGIDRRSTDDTSRSYEIQAILITFSILSTTAVVSRTYIRARVLHFFGWDDGFMVIAHMFALGAAVSIGLENKYGLGYHTWDQPSNSYVPYMKAFYASVLTFNVAMCFVKIAILFQYRRVFTIPIIKTVTFYGLAFMVAWTVAIALLNTLVCVPVARFWDSTLPGRCLDFLTLWYVMAGFNLVTDLGVFLIPLPVIKSLNLPMKQKIMLFMVFSLGFFTCAISIYRIHTLKTASSTKDPNWDNVDAAVWSFIEVTMAIITACLPTLRPIFSRLMPRLFASSMGRSSRPSNPAQYGLSLSSRSRIDKRRTRIIEHSGHSTATLLEDETISSPCPPVAYRSGLQHHPTISVDISAGKKGDIPLDSHQQSMDSTGSSSGDIKATTVIYQEFTKQ